MKYALTTLALFIAMSSAAQHNIYTDVGHTPGFSLTYDYKLTKRLSVGGGVQGYKFFRTDDGIRRFTPAIFADIRLHMRPEKNNQFFSFLDLGMNVYKQNKEYVRMINGVSHIPHDNGFYSGLGFAYLRRMTGRGGGPYASLKLFFNWHTIWRYSIVSEANEIGLLSANGTTALSVGFKF
ncbi:MAG: hypothetical protein EOP56_17330 [Sphingobacteriales bacterium]|nr:MAG: hypothetical protein EOP56_17330 [Sphingobacteriales bacterium]